MNPSLENKTILITGGTGFFGKVMAEELILNHDPKKIIIYSVMS
jgi:FlaA1/EpsC-like NDP-sugar epimerase